MLDSEPASHCEKLDTLTPSQSITATMSENGCHQSDLNGTSSPIMTKNSTPTACDVESFSTFQTFVQNSSPIISTTVSAIDSNCCATLDNTGPISQDSSNCSGPASRAVTPLISHDSSPPTLPVTQGDSPLVNVTHVTPRRPRHKPGERRELLIRAVDDVINLKISMRRAAQKYNLAKSSLCDFVRKNKICLPNLRYKSCNTVASNMSPSASRPASDGRKNLTPDGDDSTFTGTIPQKTSCGLDNNKLGVPPKEISFRPGDRIDLASESNMDHIQQGDSISMASWSEVKANMLEFMNSVARNASQLDHTQSAASRIPSNMNFCKPGRIESPWHNSAGLPTQVPMRSWSTHNSQSITSSPSNSTTGANPGRKLPFNSLNQLRHTMESVQSGILSSEAMDLSDSNSFPLSTVNSSLEDGHLGRSSDSFDESLLNSTNTLSPVGDFHNQPVGVNQNAESIETHSASHTSTQNRLCVTPSKNNATEHVCSPDSIQCDILNNSASNSCHEPGSSNQQQQAAAKSSSTSGSSESQLINPFPVNSSSVAPWSVSQSSLLGAFPSVLSTAACPSLASILSADFASLNQNAVAAFLLQHSRTLASTPSAIGAIPGFIGYPTSQPTPNIPSSLFPNDFTLQANQTQTAASNSRPSTTTRLSNGSAASALNNLANQLWNADLAQQPTTVEELQQLLYRHLQSRFASDFANSSSSLLPPMVNQLIPQLYASCANPSLRHLVTGLLTAPTVENQSIPTQASHPKSHFPGVSMVDRPGNTQLNSAQPLNIPLTTRTVPSLSDLDMNKMNLHARGLVDFINNSPSPFHAVRTACELLSSNGFRELKESESWKVKPQDCVFWKKNGSTLFAAAVGGRYRPGNGLHLLGAHTDSPSLRVKPVSNRIKEGYIQLGVETYGGGLWYTWFDRELKVAGRLVTANANGRLEEHLVHIDQPIACVPSLAIHLNPEIRSVGFNPNSEQHLVPILCTSVMDQVNQPDQDASVNMEDNRIKESDPQQSCTTSAEYRHPPSLLRALTHHLNIRELPHTFEVELYLSDSQPACIGGLHEEFIHAPRLDNLFNTYAALHGLLESMPSLEEDTAIRIVCLYDHEEVGSTSTQGADSAYTLHVLRRLINAVNSDKHTDADEPMPPACCLEESLSKSFLLSADQAHAVHPSYSDKHEMNHKPQLHGGVVLKCNVNQRYATNSLTAAAVRQVAQFANVPVQEFVIRQDMHCGSTIGPLLSSQLGVPTADVGFPQLAMHSCREMCGATSPTQAVQFYSAYFEHMNKIWPPDA